MTIHDPAGRTLQFLAGLGWTVAVAESLTGGLLAAGFVAVPGASSAFAGGVVAYATESKSQVLGVDPGLLAARGPVDPQVAEQMARGVRGLFGADVGISTTGVAGPTGQDGKPPGHVYVAVVTPRCAEVRRLQLTGDRTAVRHATVETALRLALSTVAGESRGSGTIPGGISLG